jgi:hypothetical protein
MDATSEQHRLERISDEEVKDMDEHEYVEHKPYTGPGCAICGRPRYVHDMARELRELRFENRSFEHTRSELCRLLECEPNPGSLEAAVNRLRAQRDNLAGALAQVEHDQMCPASEFGEESSCVCWMRVVRAALRELEGK